MIAESTRPNSEAAPEGSTLCLSCGLCCRGLLYPDAVLAADETELADQLGLTIYHGHKDYGAFLLPCPCFKDNQCSVYPNRPGVCGDYQCDVLRNYLHGGMSFSEASELVNQVKQLLTAIYQHLGGAEPGQRIWQQIRDFFEKNPEKLESDICRRSNARFLLDIKVLAILCKKFDARYQESWMNAEEGTSA